MEYIQREINKKEAKEKNNKDKGKNLICCDAVTIYQLGDAWILYSKHLFRISMHKMHSKKKNIAYLVGILINTKQILGKMYFANSQFQSRSQNPKNCGF